MHGQHNPEASDCMYEQDGEYREDEETFFGDAHPHLSLNQRLHLVLLLQGLENLQEAKQLNQSTDASYFEESESLDYLIVLVLVFELAHEPRQDCHEIDPEPAFKVFAHDKTAFCHKLKNVSIEIAGVEAYEDFDDEYDVYYGLDGTPPVRENKN